MSRQLLPIHLPVGVERDDVRKGLNNLAQILDIKSRYHKSGKSGSGALLVALSKLPDVLRDDQLKELKDMIKTGMKTIEADMVKCPECGVLIKASRLQKHISKVHSTPKLVTCPECGSKVRRDRLQKHLQAVHLILPNQTKAKNKVINCPVCKNPVRVDNIEEHLFEIHQPEAHIAYVRQDHNIYIDDEKGLLIKVDFQISNVKDVDCYLVAFFSFLNGPKLIGNNEEYTAEDGQVCVWHGFKPPYEATTLSDFELFIPYSALNLDEGNHQCQFHLQIFIEKPDILLFSDRRVYRFGYNFREDGYALW